MSRSADFWYGIDLWFVHVCRYGRCKVALKWVAWGKKKLPAVQSIFFFTCSKAEKKKKEVQIQFVNQEVDWGVNPSF